MTEVQLLLSFQQFTYQIVFAAREPKAVTGISRREVFVRYKVLIGSIRIAVRSGGC